MIGRTQGVGCTDTSNFRIGCDCFIAGLHGNCSHLEWEERIEFLYDEQLLKIHLSVLCIFRQVSVSGAEVSNASDCNAAISSEQLKLTGTRYLLIVSQE